MMIPGENVLIKWDMHVRVLLDVYTLETTGNDKFAHPDWKFKIICVAIKASRKRRHG